MKTAQIIIRSAFAVCFALVMSSASCDLFDKVDDVTFDISLDHTFNVNETTAGTNKVYELKQTIDAAAANSDFAKYKDKIKSITVKSVTYTVSNYTTANSVIFKDGAVGFSATAGSAATSVAKLNADDIKAAQGTEKTLDYNQAALDEVANLLKADKKVNTYLKGTFSQTPVKFDVKVVIKATVTADAL